VIIIIVIIKAEIEVTLSHQRHCSGTEQD